MTLEDPARSIIVLAAGIPLLLFHPKTRARFGNTLLFTLWFALALQSGVLSRAAVRTEFSESVANLRKHAGKETCFVVSVSSTETRGGRVRWIGRVWAFVGDDGWEGLSRPVVVRGVGQLRDEANYLVYGRYRVPDRLGRIRYRDSYDSLGLTRAFSLPAPLSLVTNDETRVGESGRPDPPVETLFLACSSINERISKLEEMLARRCERVARLWWDSLGPDAGALAGWALLGVRPPDAGIWQHPFRQTGTLHLLAISGLHLGLIGGVFWLLAKLLTGGKGWSKWIALFALGLYGILVGMPVSVRRALLMAWMLAAGPAYGRAGRIFNALGWVLALLPILDPELPARAGFPLSVSATFGVLLAGQAADVSLKKSKRIPRAWVPAIQLCAVSFGASWVTVSWSLVHFAEFYPLGLFANLIAVPVMAMVLPCLLAGGIAALLDASVASPPVALARGMGESFLELIELLALGSGQWPSYGQWTVISGLSASLVAGWLLWLAKRLLEHGHRAPLWEYRWELSLALTLVTVNLAVPAVSRKATSPTTEFTATFLDVGQGDAVLLRTPDTTWLYDTGPGILMHSDPLVPELIRRGVRSLDRVWISHGDSDHWGGLPALLSSDIRVDTLVVAARATFPDGFWMQMASAKQRPRVVRVEAPWARSLRKGVEVELLHPGSDTDLPGRNDMSLVIQIRATMGELLLVGDLEVAGETALRATGRRFESLIAQTGHHGSRTSGSRDWYDQVDPVLLIGSLGRQNRYGFPHDAILETSQERKAPFLRTDLDGTIEIEFGLDEVRVRREGLGKDLRRLTLLANGP